MATKVCKMQTPKGKNSELYIHLRDTYSQKDADNTYAYIKSDEFKALFGNWELFYNYDHIVEKKLKPIHDTEEAARKHADDINELYGKGATNVTREGDKWKVDLVKPPESSVSSAVDANGEPLLMYHDDNLLSFTSKLEDAGKFEAPEDYDGEMPLPLKGHVLPYFLFIRTSADGTFDAETGKATIIDEDIADPAIKGLDVGIRKPSVKKVRSNTKEPNVEEEMKPTDEELEEAVELGKDLGRISNKIRSHRELANEAISILQTKKEILTKKAEVKEGRGASEEGGTIINIKKEIARMEKLLAKNKDIEALVSFLEFAQDQATTALDGEETNLEDIVAEINKKDATYEEKRTALRKLARSGDYLSAFSIVGEIYRSIKNKEFQMSTGKEIADAAFRDVYISPVIRAIEDAKAEYTLQAREVIADYLIQYNTDPNLTREDIVQMLTHVNEDIKIGTVWLNALAESRDQILELAAKALNTERTKMAFRIESFKNTKLIPALKALEADQKVGGKTNFEKLYDFMLARDAEGKLTGKYIEPGSIEAGRRNMSEAQKNFLQLFHEEYQKANKYLHSSVRKGNELPAILKSGWQRATQDVKGLGSLAKSTVKYVGEQFTVQVDDVDLRYIEVVTDESGKEYKFIPTQYTAKFGKKDDKGIGINVEDVSLDLASSLIRFMTMADNYRTSMKMATEMEAIDNLLATRQVTKKKGGVVAIEKGSLKFGKDPKPVTEPGIKSNAYKMFSEFMDIHFYGQRKHDMGEFLGINVTKAVDTMNKYTAVRMLAFNLYSGINNRSVGAVMNIIEGAGGQFYTRKDYRQARIDYYKQINEFMADSLRRAPQNPINLFMHSYDVFQEFDEFGKPIDSALKVGRAVSKVGFSMQTATEHMTQTELALAMMRSHRLIKGKIMNFQDWAIVNNKDFVGKKAKKEAIEEFEKLGPTVREIITVKDGVSWTSKKVAQKEILNFVDRIKGVYQRNHGNYGTQDQPIIMKYALGRLVMMMRRWLKPGWDRRWQKENFDGREAFNQRLGANIAGNYVVTLNFLNKYKKELLTLQFQTLGKNFDALPAWKKSQIRKTLAEGFFIAASAMVILALGNLDAGDDDEWLKSIAVYQAHRLNSELRFYTSLPEALAILRSPSATINTVETVIDALDAMHGPMFNVGEEWMEWEKYERGKHAGEYKASVQLQKLLPYSSQIQRIIDPYHTAKFMQNL